LAALFKEHLNAEYTQADYVQQFTIRIPENLAKLGRVEKIADAPQILYDTFAEARNRLRAAAEKHGDCISPSDLANQK
jgi:phosphoenolpyruvate carboxykinase (GTP)